jgi:hypothetical protein
MGNRYLTKSNPTKVFNKYHLNTINELRIQHANTESNKFSFQGAFHQGFPEIINIPVTKSEA